MNFKTPVITGLAICYALSLHAQTPIHTQQLNTTYYVGQVSGVYPTIQSAVTAACAVAGANINIPAGATPSDTISSVTGGCPTASIVDQRQVNNACYSWNGVGYTSQSCVSSDSGGLNTDTYNTGNNGFTKTFASPDCTGPCIAIRPNTSTDNSWIPLPPSGSTAVDHEASTNVTVKYNPPTMFMANALGGSRSCNGKNWSFCTVNLFDTQNPQAIAPANWASGVTHDSATDNKWGYSYGTAPNAGIDTWSGMTVHNDDVTFNSQGITQMLGMTGTKYAGGDFASIYAYGFSDGGSYGYADEGVDQMTLEGGENANYFHGDVGTGATTGTSSLPIVYNSAFSPASMNRNSTTGAIADIIDTTRGVTAGTITGATATLSGIPNVGIIPVTTTGTAVTATNAYGNLGCELPVPVQTNPNIHGTVTCNITNVQGVTAQFVVGNAEISGDYPEQVNISAVSGSGSTQSVTFSYLHPHGASVSSLWQGSNVTANYISYDANYAVAGFREILHVYGAIDSSHLVVQDMFNQSATYNPYIAPMAITGLSKTGTTLSASFASTAISGMYRFDSGSGVVAGCSDSGLNVATTNIKLNYVTSTVTGTQAAGGASCPTATISLPASTFGFHIYPGAEIYGPAIAAPANLPLGINTTDWTPGDAIEIPHHPYWSGGNIKTFYNVFNTLPQGNKAGDLRVYLGGGVSGTFVPLSIAISNPCTIYIGCGGWLAPVPMIQLGGYGTSTPNGGAMVMSQPPLAGNAIIKSGLPDPALGGVNDTNPIKTFEFGWPNSQLYYYPDITAYGAAEFIAGSSANRGFGTVAGGQILINGYSDSGDALKFKGWVGSGSQISLCDHNAVPSGNSETISVGNCNNNDRLSAPDGRLDAAVLNAQASALIGSVVAGLSPPTAEPGVVYTGTPGTSARTYNFTVVSPLGIEGNGGLHGPTVNTVASLDPVNNFVTITCPKALQPNYPAGTTYKVWDGFAQPNQYIGVCPIGGTLIDNGNATIGTQPVLFGNNTSLAGQYQVELGGSIGFWSSNTGGGVLDTFINRLATNKLGFGSTAGSAHDGTIEATNIVADTSMTIGGLNPCMATGLNCPGTRGRITLVSGTATVTTPAATTTANYQLTNCAIGGTAGLLSVGTITSGTSFVVNSSSAIDTSTICWSVQ